MSVVTGVMKKKDPVFEQKMCDVQEFSSQILQQSHTDVGEFPLPVMYAINAFIPQRNSSVRWLCPQQKLCVAIIAATKGHSYVSNSVFPQQVTITLAICTSAGHWWKWSLNVSGQ